MRIEQDIKLDFKDVLIKPKRSILGSRAGIDLYKEFTTLYSKQKLKTIPIIAANLDTTGTFSMCESLSRQGMMTCLHKFYKPDQLIEFFNKNRESHNAFYTLGLGADDVLKFKDVYLKGINVDKICIDVANGYTKYFVEKVAEIREMYPQAIIMAGNVATPEMTQEILIQGGADIVKIGIGPGGLCTTRKVTGIGYPQLSAIIEAADAAHGAGGLVCADGGCKESGDICKAFAAGADFVMLGSMLTGHDECEGEWEEEFDWKPGEKGAPKLEAHMPKKKTFLNVYGMSSKEAQEKYYGGVAAYRASEGTCTKVPYKGPVQNTIQQILGGLRSCCTYVGAGRLKDLSKCTTFVMVR